MLKSDLAYYFALWRLGKIPPEKLPTIAVEALESGFDSTSLRKLAGLQAPTTADIGDLAEAVSTEIGFAPCSSKELPSRQDDEWLKNAVPIARRIANDILEDRTDIANAWLSLPYREKALGPLQVFSEGLDPTSSVNFDEAFRDKIKFAAKSFLEQLDR